MANPWGDASSSNNLTNAKPQDTFGKVSTNVTNLNIATRDLNSLVKSLGTAKDGKKLRLQLKNHKRTNSTSRN